MPAEQFLRRAGYGYIRDRRSGQESFVRRFGAGFYPRLHMYFEEKGEQIIFNLHLDQKQASYEGANHMHNADHEGPVVEAEIERLKKHITHNMEQGTGDTQHITRNMEQMQTTQKKKSWWKLW